ncbi:uncharacterized protein CC84DRAFT_497005 [Paraphaeosphaeria sporulosa]|uniref:Uncharacterized protein n=1 Tax=Paraphaeosphaeria sporulosa TaxID=1460663 RepID=A0A177CVT0_9PLEO|nr:uncharacterized protein CC84DRAFT_497005 [Paraphaeosphaeria sporulosa]OAG10897.1 hypothetical protein CC84DRAFT_497005 [Paraphaeosphaeria sporulosa]
MSELQEKGMPRSLELLSPFLASEPKIRHVLSPDWNEPITCADFPCAEIHCDIFIVESPSTGAFYETINTEMLTLRCDSKQLLIGDIYGDRPWRVFKQVVLGLDHSNKLVHYNLGSGVCTFIFLFFWKSLESMNSFKQPSQESTGSRKQKLDSRCWTTGILERFAKLENVGAQVRQGTFRLRPFQGQYPLIWWVPDSWHARTVPSPGLNKSWQLRLLLWIQNKIFRRRPKPKIRYTK